MASLKVVDKRFLYNSESQSELTKLTEKAEHFDGWDFGVVTTPITPANRCPNPIYLGRRPFSELKCPSSLWMVRMSEIVHVAPGLVQQKVIADVLHGAEHNKAWKDWTRVIDMDVAKVTQPTITEDDFTVMHRTAGAKAAESGGKFGSISFDCSEDLGLHTVVLGIKKTWIKDANWNAVQEATTVGGAAFYKHVAKDLATDLAAAAGGTETFDTDLYKTAVKAIATNRKAGFNPDAILTNPDQEATFMAMDKFISIEMLGRVGRLAEEGVIGNFYGTIPVYSSGVVGANPIVYTRAKGKLIGLRQDIQIEDYDDPIQGLEGAVLTMRFVTATAFASAIRKLATS